MKGWKGYMLLIACSALFVIILDILYVYKKADFDLIIKRKGDQYEIV